MVPVALLLLLSGALAKPPPSLMEDDGNFTMEGIILEYKNNLYLEWLKIFG